MDTLIDNLLSQKPNKQPEKSNDNAPDEHANTQRESNENGNNDESIIEAPRPKRTRTRRGPANKKTNVRRPSQPLRLTKEQLENFYINKIKKIKMKQKKKIARKTKKNIKALLKEAMPIVSTLPKRD